MMKSKSLKKPSAKLVERARDDAAVETTAETIKRVRKLVDGLQEQQQAIAKLTADLATAAAAERKTREETLPLLMDEIGLREIKLDDGRKIIIDTVYHPQLLKDDQPEFFAWLKKNKFDSMIKNQITALFSRGQDKEAVRLLKELRKEGFDAAQKRFIEPQTFKAFVRERMEKGADLPSVVNPNPVRTTLIK